MTRAMLRGWLGVVIAALLVAGFAWTAEETGKPFVIIVGISEYQDKQIQPRKHAETDAKALYDLLANKQYLANPDQVKLLLGKKDEQRPSELATKENILKAIHWAAQNAAANDPIVFIFLGQGAPVGERICFFGVDSTFKDRTKTAVLGADIEHELDNLKSQKFVALLDVNLKGWENPDKQPVAEPNPNDFIRIFLGNEEREDHSLPQGKVVFLATNGLRPSLDLEKNGLFTHALLDAIKGAADKEGYEPDGLVSMDELVDHLSKQIPELARTHGKSKEEKEQFFFVRGGSENHFPLTRNPAAAPKAMERVAKFGTVAKDQKLPAEVVEEGDRILSRMPKLQAHQELRKTYQKLVDGGLSAEDFLKERTKILDGMKLKRSEAVSYATKVMQGINMLREQYVKDLNQGELVGWAVRGLYRRVDEKKVPDNVKDRLNRVKTLKEADLITLLADVRDGLGKREDLANEKDVDLSLMMMMSHLDPYTNYIDRELKEQMERDMRGGFSGIGIQIRRDVARDQLLVVTPLKGGPAYKAGVQAGDIIVTVKRKVDSNGKPLEKEEVIPTKGLPLNEAVAKILGVPDTEVTIVIEREGEKQPKEFTIKRGLINLETVMGFRRKTNSDEWDFLLDPENRIGYFRLTQFSRNTYRDLFQVVSEMSQQPGGIKGLVLDLRFNPGGLLQSAVDISDLFIDDGLIVSIRPRVGREHSFTGEHEGSLLNFPMVCLVNGGSASGSEIVSAALQDHKRALVIGERSFGKGSVQNILPFKPTGGQIKLTTASFWRPNGKNLNKSSTKGGDDEDWGVIPDKVVNLTRAERDQLAEHQRDSEIIHAQGGPKEAKAFKDVQLDGAMEYLRTQIKASAKAPAKKAG